jgi:HEPN domain-containing protein
MDRLEFQRLALERLDDAVALLAAERYAGAYYISGYAVECALKACISRLTLEGAFPPRNAADYYVHNLTKLRDSALLQTAYDREAQADRSFEANWGAVKDWNEQARYRNRDRRQAEEMLAAINDPQHGVLQWLKRNW